MNHHPAHGKRLAAIDLGTNTFHMQLVEVQSDGAYQTLERTRHFIKLAEDGIERIGNAPFARALAAMQSFAEVMDRYRVKEYRAIGTAALRTAANGPDFLQQVHDTTGLNIDIIDGDEEARLIYEGVSAALTYDEHTDVIMDVGGGSVEFIFATEKGVQWARSFPVGVAVLRRKFHRHEPITDEEVAALRGWLGEMLAPVLEVAQRLRPRRLIGASGSFDVLEMMLSKERINAHHAVVDVAKFPQLLDRTQRATFEERLKIEGLPADRADMIVVAFLLIDFVMEHFRTEQVDVVSFAMKEGILREIIDAYAATPSPQ